MYPAFGVEMTPTCLPETSTVIEVVCAPSSSEDGPWTVMDFGLWLASIVEANT